MLRAVTFDLWNTLVHEGPSGLIRPRSERWQAILGAAGHTLDLDHLDAAHRAALADYQDAWRGNRQFRSAEAVTAGLNVLGLQVDDDVSRQLQESFHHAGLESEVTVVPGAIETLRELKSRDVKTAIICDIGLTPSTALCNLLERAGLLTLIDVQTWSDVRGTYKPDPAIFEWTLAELAVEPADALHVGDRLRTDVAGARGAGMATARLRSVYDDDADLPEADWVIDDLTAVVSIAEGTAA